MKVSRLSRKDFNGNKLNALFSFLSQICSKPQKQENLNLNVSFVFKLLNILWCFTESAVFASLGFFRHGLGFSVPGNLKWVAHCTVSSENSYAPGSFPQNPSGRALVLNSFVETRSPLETSSYSGTLMNAIFCIKQSSVLLDYMPLLVLCSCVLFIAFLIRYDFLVDFTGSCFEKELGKHDQCLYPLKTLSFFGLSLFIFVAISRLQNQQKLIKLRDSQVSMSEGTLMMMTSDSLHNTSLMVLHLRRADTKNKSDLKTRGY